MISALHMMIDAESVVLVNETDNANWYDHDSQSELVRKFHRVVKALDLVEHFNFNMDMLSREDLCI